VIATFLEHRDYTTAIDVNPHYITPKMMQLRLQKIMDEYVAGVATWYQTNARMLEIAEKKLLMLRWELKKVPHKQLIRD
jgi:adenylylsulfate reductase, subunit A